MWICNNDSFVSAVEDKNDNTRLLVRARNKEHLKVLFPDHEIFTNQGTDYAHRVSCSKEEFAKIISDRILSIKYGNFKNSVEDTRLYDLYAEFWGLHWEYQANLNRPYGYSVNYGYNYGKKK